MYINAEDKTLDCIYFGAHLGIWEKNISGSGIQILMVISNLKQNVYKNLKQEVKYQYLKFIKEKLVPPLT